MCLPQNQMLVSAISTCNCTELHLKECVIKLINKRESSDICICGTHQSRKAKRNRSNIYIRQKTL